MDKNLKNSFNDKKSTLKNYKEQFYQSVIYDENNKNPIIQNDFGLDPIISRSETQDVFVIYQKGGKLKSGERILYNNAIFKDYMVKLWETNTVENTDGNGNFKYYPRLSTDELLNISVEYGYKKVRKKGMFEFVLKKVKKLNPSYMT